MTLAWRRMQTVDAVRRVEAELPDCSEERGSVVERLASRQYPTAGSTGSSPRAVGRFELQFELSAFTLGEPVHTAFPRTWCHGFHQRVSPAWSLPLSRAITRMSRWVG
jgi:hypothetical protein